MRSPNLSLDRTGKARPAGQLIVKSTGGEAMLRTLEDVLDELGMTKNKLSRRMNLSASKLSSIFTGAEVITPEAALKLEKARVFRPISGPARKRVSSDSGPRSKKSKKEYKAKARRSKNSVTRNRPHRIRPAKKQSHGQKTAPGRQINLVKTKKHDRLREVLVAIVDDPFALDDGKVHTCQCS